jgi:hypothetical protein
MICVVRVLQAIVGHQLPVYFLNSVRSVRRLAPDDDLLVVDNASGSSELIEALSRLADSDARITLRLRSSNDISRNAKVGGLYDAYGEILTHALGGGYDLLHLIQADMQMVWWDERALDAAWDMFVRVPECVNVHTSALPADMGDGVLWRDARTREIAGYGITDTGFYHLARWRERGVRFGESESGHSRHYHALGLRTLVHPVPPIAPVPWPAVVRSGRVCGREVRLTRELLLRPLNAEELAERQAHAGDVWLEDVCIPWGWSSLTPMASTAPESLDWWVYRYRELRARKWRGALPSWTRSGLDRGESRLRVQRRPSLAALVFRPLRAALRRRRQTRRASA